RGRRAIEAGTTAGSRDRMTGSTAIGVVQVNHAGSPACAQTRFEAERQALALMDHPNIAKVLDAGTTEGGRPYFVLELVKGVAISPTRPVPNRIYVGLSDCSRLRPVHSAATPR